MPNGLYQITSDPREFRVKISDEFAQKDWDNDASQLLQEFRAWITETKDAEQHEQAGTDDGGGGPQS